MKIDTSLLQGDPEALDQSALRCQNNNEVSFLYRVQKNIKRHEFIHIIKVVLYLELLLALGVIGCISLSNYYSRQEYSNDDAPYIQPASVHTGKAFVFNSNGAPRERISWHAKDADTLVSTEPNQITSEPNVEATKEFVRTDSLESSAKTITKIEEDRTNKMMSDLSKIEEVIMENLDTMPIIPNSEQISVVSSVSLEINGSDPLTSLVRDEFLPHLDIKDDNVPLGEDDVSKYSYSDELGDDQFLQKILLSLPYEKRLSTGSDTDSDSGSWDDAVAPLDVRRKRSEDCSSSESSSSSSENKSSSRRPKNSSSDSSSSSSESGSAETVSRKKAARTLVTEIINKMEQSDCTQPSNVAVPPDSDHSKYVKSLKDRLVKWIFETPVPDCNKASASITVDKCGNLSYKCPNDGIEVEEIEVN